MKYLYCIENNITSKMYIGVRFTGKNRNGRLHHIQLKGQLLEDLLNDNLSNKFIGEKYNLKPASICSRRCSDKFLKIKNKEVV